MLLKVRKFVQRVALAACLSGLTAAVANAMPITTPAGLSPGDQYRLAFVTSTTRDATSADIADYNAFVQNVADSSSLASLGATWTAIGSTSAVDARDNTNTNPNVATGIGIYNLAGNLVAANNADLWDGSLSAPISVFENGNTATSTLVWTGTTQDGTGNPLLVLGTLDESLTGLSPAVDDEWVNSGESLVGSSFHLYAISGTLTVPVPVPEPATLTLVSSALFGLWLARRRRRTPLA